MYNISIYKWDLRPGALIVTTSRPWPDRASWSVWLGELYAFYEKSMHFRWNLSVCYVNYESLHMNPMYFKWLLCVLGEFYTFWAPSTILLVPVPSTWYQAPGTWYQVPSTWYQVLGTKYQVLGTRYQVLSTKYLVPGTKYLVPGTRYLVPSTKYYYSYCLLL